MKECKLYHLHGRYYLVCWDNDLNIRVTYKKKGDRLVNIEDETDSVRFDEVVACRTQPGTTEKECWYEGPIEGESSHRFK